MLAFRVALVRAAFLGHGVSVADVATAFLNAPMPEGVELCVEPPAESNAGPDDVWYMLKSLYGWRGAPQCWQEHLTGILTKLGFKRLTSDGAVYFYDGGGHADLSIVLVIHVDDVLATGRLDIRMKFMDKLAIEFDLKHRVELDEVGQSQKLLGRIVRRTQKGYAIETCREAVLSLVDEWGLASARPVSTPALVDVPDPSLDFEVAPREATAFRRGSGKVLWWSQDRTDLQFTAKSLAVGLRNPTARDVAKLKRCLRYLIGCASAVLLLEPVMTGSKDLVEEVDADWAADIKTRRSTSGGVLLWLGCLVFSWCRGQHVPALSSAESELYSMNTGAIEGLFARSLLSELNYEVKLYMYTDSASGLAICGRTGLSSRAKHIDIRQLFMQDLKKREILHLLKLPGQKNRSDILTKAVQAAVMDRHLEALNFVRIFEASKGSLKMGVHFLEFIARVQSAYARLPVQPSLFI